MMLEHLVPDGLPRLGERIFVLDADRELARAVPEDRLERALAASLTPTVHLEPGSWDARRDAGLASDGYGLLVLGGFLVRGVGVGGRFGAEVLTRGDLLRPWQHDGEEAVLPFEMTWRVVLPVRLAVLDHAWTTRMAAFPEIGPALAGRALERSRRLASVTAIVQQPRLDDRLWLLFWELADRHGRVHPDGVHLDLPLTHEILSHLAAARRPSVSSALGRLTAAGKLGRSELGWVLRGEPPGRPDSS
jgi:CRP/FNR family cyclic AMP-dependent transcriptional regulator